MRPQHITAENWWETKIKHPSHGCFNEAAAYHCGKHVAESRHARDLDASMRPQHITAENAACHPLQLVTEAMLQ